MRAHFLAVCCMSALLSAGCESEADRLERAGRTAHENARATNAGASAPRRAPSANTTPASRDASTGASNATLDASSLAASWPPQGDGCVSYASCCSEISKVLPSIGLCQLLYNKHRNCNAARREFTQRWQRTGGALPPDCK